MCIVLLVTNEPCFAAGFVSVMERQDEPGLEVQACVTDLPGGIEAARLPGADVVAVDAAMPGFDNDALVAFCRALNGRSGLLLLGHAKTREAVEAAFSAGARGYLLKSAREPDLVDAARRVGGGETYLDPRLVPIMTAPQPARLDKAIYTPFGALPSRVSAREMSVLRRTAYGYSAKEIARDLDISQKSVETYKARAIAKLGLASRSDIIRYAHRAGWFNSITEFETQQDERRPH
ncbi:LuxR C-terminal-related transcriptional regulator [Aureimonas sp. AU40]|uniref:LuxR C-terminal-related transcriptional regulator n=1 Tax=Aureimonas sp. AU40 TaxID=1637747 RepID=UPI0007814095|nr:response regulator transcription factor [Aureimonas sp. AU40]